MIPVAFRSYDVEVDDFPILMTISTEQNAPPKTPEQIEVSYVHRSRNELIRVTIPATIDPATNSVQYSIPVPANFTSGLILFSILAAIPVAQTSPYIVEFLSADAQKAKDKIFPDVVTPVFANFSMELK